MTSSNPQIWPILNYADAPAAIEWLGKAFGFEPSIVVPNENDASVVEHSQLAFPEGGGIMLSSANRPDNPFSHLPTGAASVYVVSQNPDELHDRAIAAGAKIFMALKEEDYGSRGFSVTDPEGNIWSFGTYSGES